MFRVSGAPRGDGGGFHLGKGEPRVIEKGSSSSGQFDSAGATSEQLDANIGFQVLHLATERRLRRVQPFFGRERQAPLLGDRDEVAKVA